MKKYILIGFVITLLIVSTVNATAYSEKIQTASKDFTHQITKEKKMA